MKKLSIIIAIIRGMIFRVLHQENVIHHRICRGGVKLYRGSSIHIVKGSTIDIGKSVSFYQNVKIDLRSAGAQVKIGENTFINRDSKNFLQGYSSYRKQMCYFMGCYYYG